MKGFFFSLNYSGQFLVFFDIALLQKSNDVSICNYVSSFFALDGFFKLILD